MKEKKNGVIGCFRCQYRATGGFPSMNIMKIPEHGTLSLYIVLSSVMGCLTYAEKSDIHLMYDLVNVTAGIRYECVKRAILIDECRTTEFFSRYATNFVEKVLSTAPGTKRVS